MSSVVRDCLKQYAQTAISEAKVGTALRCPSVAPKCEEALHPSDVRKALGDEASAWAKYEQFAFSRFVETHARDGVACCPTPGCPYVFEWDPANRKFACEVRGQACCRAPRRHAWRQAGDDAHAAAPPASGLRQGLLPGV